ncbi:MAG TPA: sialidase family protein [Armatimonadota bacterium]|nr:sialidase family protein [Armatimonadota bacterium]
MNLRIRDGRDWAFINGAWSEDAWGCISPPDTPDHHALAFYLPQAFADATVEFEFLASYRETGAGDVGVILRAQAANHYYWVSFPWCGQQTRARHFWAAISRVDESGYIRNLKLALIPGVLSETERWYRARVECVGGAIRLWVDDRPGPVVTDLAAAPGRIGFAGYGGFALRNLRVSGDAAPAPAWDETAPAGRGNWFHPAPGIGGEQTLPSLCRAPRGDLLLAIPATRAERTFIVRSRDNGHSWGEPVELPAALHWGVVHATKSGRLLLQAVHAEPRRILMAESHDDGRTWSEPTAAKLSGDWPADPPQLHAYGALLELPDGALVRLLTGRLARAADREVMQWGAMEAQAFAIRSTDGGATWSAPANLDRFVWRGQAGAAESCLDLSEPVGAVLDDGRIICYIRPIYSPWMWETHSDDGGQTWSSARRAPFPGYAACMTRTKSGAALVAHRFPGHTIHLSHDGGRTWDEGTTVDFPVWAMGALLEVEPEVVLFVYMDAKPERLRAQRIRVTAQGLEPLPVEGQAAPDRTY